MYICSYLSADSGTTTSTSCSSNSDEMTGFEAVPILELAEPQVEGSNKMYQAYKGQLKLSVYINCGHLTVHGMSWGNSGEIIDRMGWVKGLTG